MLDIVVGSPDVEEALDTSVIRNILGINVGSSVSGFLLGLFVDGVKLGIIVGSIDVGEALGSSEVGDRLGINNGLSVVGFFLGLLVVGGKLGIIVGWLLGLRVVG